MPSASNSPQNTFSKTSPFQNFSGADNFNSFEDNDNLMDFQMSQKESYDIDSEIMSCLNKTYPPSPDQVCLNNDFEGLMERMKGQNLALNQQIQVTQQQGTNQVLN